MSGGAATEPARLAAKSVQRENTRAKLIAAAVQLLASRSLMDLTTSDVAAAAGFSNAAFYVYFRDVYEVVLAACQSAGQSPPELLAALAEPWTPQTAQSRAAELIGGYFALWDRHRAVLRARNIASEGGRPEFVKARQLAVAPLALALRQQIGWGQAAGRIPEAIDATAAANVLVAMMERTGSVQHDYEELEEGWLAKYRDAAIHILLSALGFRGRSGACRGGMDDV